MVESDANGCCPRCGTPAPKISSAQANIVEPARRRWLLPAGVLAGVAVVALLAAPPLLERMHHPSELVDGDFRSAHLGVRLQFPDGWRHLDEGDRAPSGGLDRLAEVFRDPLSVRSSRFFRGSAGDPAAELLLVVGSRATELGDAAFAAWAQAAADAPIRELTSVRNLRLFQCTAGATVPHAGLRCVGAASRTTAYVYVFPAHGNVTLAVFLSRAGPEATLAESAELVTNLDPT
jgi:hypothetical protein